MKEKEKTHKTFHKIFSQKTVLGIVSGIGKVRVFCFKNWKIIENKSSKYLNEKVCRKKIGEIHCAEFVIVQKNVSTYYFVSASVL